MARSDPAQDLRLLDTYAAARFALSSADRIVRESEPDNSAGPRLFLAGCAAGNIIRLRHDVDDEIAAKTLAMAKNEPPWSDPAVTPRCLDALIELLPQESPPNTAVPALIYQLPNDLTYSVGATIVRSDGVDGGRLVSRLALEGMPPHLVEAGFVSLGDFWEPWCAAMVGDEIGAMAFAARIGDESLEVGVYTFPGFRGRGLAAAVTANWSSLPSLAARTLFYSTSTTNRSSQRVAERLGLRRFGVSLSID